MDLAGQCLEAAQQQVPARWPGVAAAAAAQENTPPVTSAEVVDAEMKDDSAIQGQDPGSRQQGQDPGSGQQGQGIPASVLAKADQVSKQVQRTRGGCSRGVKAGGAKEAAGGVAQPAVTSLPAAASLVPPAAFLSRIQEELKITRNEVCGGGGEGRGRVVWCEGGSAGWSGLEG